MRLGVGDFEDEACAFLVGGVEREVSTQQTGMMQGQAESESQTLAEAVELHKRIKDVTTLFF